MKLEFLLSVDCNTNEIDISMFSSELPEKAFLLGKVPTFTQALFVIQSQYTAEILCNTNSEKENENDSGNKDSKNSTV